MMLESASYLVHEGRFLRSLSGSLLISSTPQPPALTEDWREWLYTRQAGTLVAATWTVVAGTASLSDESLTATTATVRVAAERGTLLLEHAITTTTGATHTRLLEVEINPP